MDVLDGSRVHPEAYEWARKMAVDALEYDDTAEDANPAGALEEILESPERLKDLDLDAFAEELERQVGTGRCRSCRHGGCFQYCTVSGRPHKTASENGVWFSVGRLCAT